MENKQKRQPTLLFVKSTPEASMYDLVHQRSIEEKKFPNCFKKNVPQKLPKTKHRVKEKILASKQNTEQRYI